MPKPPSIKLSSAVPSNDPAPVLFADQKAWASWLRLNHEKESGGVWLRIAKKGSSHSSVTYLDAVESALCYGWIDAQKKAEDADFSLQRFVPRAPRSIWSKINREKALRLIEEGKMKKAGLREIERAKANGRWDAAYDSPSKATVPEDLQAALDAAPKAKKFFATLSGANRYAILFRIQTVKKPETRARKVQEFVEMLARQEKIHP